MNNVFFSYLLQYFHNPKYVSKRHNSTEIAIINVQNPLQSFRLVQNACWCYFMRSYPGNNTYTQHHFLTSDAYTRAYVNVTEHGTRGKLVDISVHGAFRLE